MSGRVLYLDAIGGASGDMICGALLDVGVSLETMKEALAALRLAELDVRVERTERHAISANRFVVEHPEEHHHRTYRDIDTMLGALSGDTQRIARTAFAKLAAAEAKVHGIAVDDVHFHEVGALDSIADIVCAAAGFAALEREHPGLEVLVSSLPLGQGFVRAAHGVLPLPAPATLECLAGFDTYDSGLQAECVTPTGAALLAAVARSSHRPSMRPLHVGWGAGTRDSKERPNVLRAILAEHAQTLAHGASDLGLRTRELILLETNLDDTSPEVVASCVDELLEAGARDAWQTSITMKKGRVAVKLSALADLELQASLSARIMASTGTLGVRALRVSRTERDRRIETVSTPYGPIRVKIADGDGLAPSAKAEYDDCQRAARKHQVTLEQVRQAAESAIKQSHSSPGSH